MRAMSITYSSYLKLDDLLDCQRPLSDGPEHDEMLFIVIHQVYELWFKQMLHEVDYLQTRARRGRRSPARSRRFKRVLTILKVLVAQIDVLETMTPISFLSFRSRLEAASRLPVAAVPRARVRCSAHATGACSRTTRTRRRARSSSGALARADRSGTSFLRFLGRHGFAVPARAARARPRGSRTPRRPELQPR